MAAPLTLGQASDLTDLSIQKIFPKIASPEEQFKKYYNFRTTSDYYEKDSSMTGLSEADFVDENAVIPADTPLQGYDKTYTQVTVSQISSLSEKMWRFGIKRRNIEQCVIDLKNAISRKREKLAAERLTNGFETTSYTHQGTSKNTTITISGGDGLGFIDDDHTREDGGSNMNNYVYDGSTYNLPFDYAGLKAAHRTMALFVDGRGNPDPTSPTTLVCKRGSSVHFKAMEILGAIKNGKIPESNDNDGSAVGAFEVIPLDYLTQDAYWWMFDKNKKNDRYGLQFVESVAITPPEKNVVFKTNEIQYKCESMFDLGFNDSARSWVGSIGTSANPST